MRNRPMTEDEIDEAARLYESGLSLVKAIKIIGMGTKTILIDYRSTGLGGEMKVLPLL